MATVNFFGVPSRFQDDPSFWTEISGTQWFWVFPSALKGVPTSTVANYTPSFFFGPGGISGESLRLTGNGFSYNGTTPVSGSITQVEFIDADGVTVKARITLSAPVSLASFVNASSPAVAGNLLLGGDDLITGSGEGDGLAGFSGSDSIFGGGGDDFITPGAYSPTLLQTDTVDGGTGTDTVSLDFAVMTTALSLAFSTQQTAQGQTLFDGTIIRNVENVQATFGSGGDTITGGAGNDSLYGGAGADSLSGGDGNDLLGANNFNPFIGLTLEADTLDGGVGIDTALVGMTGTSAALNIDFSAAATPTGLLLGGVLRLRNIEQVEFYSGSGSDSLVGGSLNDEIFGGDGLDTVRGGAGDDYISGGSLFGGTEPVGTEILDGGTGVDTAQLVLSIAGSYNFNQVGTSNGQTFQRAANAFTLVQNVEAMNLSLTGNGLYVLTMTGGDDVIFTGGSGPAFQISVDLGGGNDFAIGTQLSDTLNGGEGVDDLIGQDGADTLNGGAGNDSLAGGAGIDALTGGAGADELFGDQGVDTAIYHASTAIQLDLGFNRAFGGEAEGDTFSGIENVSGTNESDGLWGDGAANRLDGWWGFDWLDGRGGNDTLAGGGQSDNLMGGDGADYLDGGDGFDYARYDLSTSGVQLDLLFSNGVGGEAQGDFFVSIEGVSGSNFNDGVWGTNEQNAVYLWFGDDYADGRGGDDFLFGLDGKDTLAGGQGADQLYGGADSDTFAFALGHLQAGVRDVIHDFTDGADTLLFQGLVPGTFGRGQFGSDVLLWVSLAGGGFGEILVTNTTLAALNDQIVFG